MGNRLEGKVALITGGNSGIGLETARIFVAEGAKVAITGRNQETLDAAAKELGVLAVRADTTNRQEAEAAVAATVERFGGLDVVFANAGIAGTTPVGETSTEAFERILSINVTGVFLTVQAAVPHLREGGSIVLNGSVHVDLAMPGYAAYAASKGAVRSMGKVLAAELAPKGIRVNVVHPGATRTPIWGDRLTPEFEAVVVESTPLKRMGEAEDVANTVLFLASDEARHLTALDVLVDGGLIGAGRRR